MNRRSFLVPVVIVSLAAAGFTQSLSFNVAGVTRNYLLHVPTGTLTNPALVFMLHGHGMDGTSQESGSKWYPLADREKFIVAYPNAISQNWDVSATSNDLTFILAIIDTIDAKYHIDRNRIYVAGFSQGAAMCHMCGCAHSEIFAAIAPASGSLGGTCTLKRPVPVMMSFGTSGDIASPASFMTSVTTWAKLDSCPLTPKITRPYPPTNPKSVETRVTFGPGKDGAIVIADSAQGRGHEWPMDTVNAINNTAEAWAFFKQFTLKGAVTAIIPQNISLFHESISALYSSGVVRLQGTREEVNTRVFDIKGRLVASAEHRQFEFKNHPSGVYTVAVGGNHNSVALRMVIP